MCEESAVYQGINLFGLGTNGERPLGLLYEHVI